MNKNKILIVDDCKLITVGLKTTLSAESNIEIADIASNGHLAVEMAKKHNPDLILMDIGMPIMDGIQATKIIKKDHPNIKIVMLTSHYGDQEVLDAFTAGANSYCMKDIEGKELINVIKTTIGGASWLDPHIAQIVLRGLQNNTEEKNPNSPKERPRFCFASPKV